MSLISVLECVKPGLSWWVPGDILRGGGDLGGGCEWGGIAGSVAVWGWM